MVKVDSTKISSSSIAVKCEKYAKPLLKRKKIIDLDSIGNQQNNNLVDFLNCQCKALKACADVQKSYSNCHSSVMGTGSYVGRKNCGEELEKLLTCVLEAGK
mmetsp:Transcript_7201/g.10672  ORF Transcript_7201/g.10672 Transcript_7201/m.10672 type:complete len:102 (-) Transcript_7201:2495-2800(-)